MEAVSLRCRHCRGGGGGAYAEMGAAGGTFHCFSSKSPEPSGVFPSDAVEALGAELCRSAVAASLREANEGGPG